MTYIVSSGALNSTHSLTPPLTSGEVNITYMTLYDVILTHQTGNGCNLPYCRVGDLCKISSRFQLNVTVVFCYIVTE